MTRGTTVLISVVLLTAIVNRLDLPILWEVIREADWGGLLVAISVFGLGILFGAWRWHLMLRLGGNVVHPGATLRGTMMGHCFHTFVFGAAGGDVLKSGVYARWYGLKMSEVLAAAPLDRFIALGGARENKTKTSRRTKKSLALPAGQLLPHAQHAQKLL